MHHSAVKSHLVDTGSDTKIYNNYPLCPKPRRLGSTVPEFIKSLGCSNPRNISHLNSNGRSGILNMIISENTTDGRGPLCSSGFSQSCYSGSPPGRTSNPLVHDVHFVNQMDQYSPYARTKRPEKFGFASASPACEPEMAAGTQLERSENVYILF